MNNHCLPFIDTKNNTTHKLLVVEPTAKIERTEAQLVIPQGMGEESEKGIVLFSCEGSSFKTGDKITYSLVDRSKPDNYETFLFNGKECDIIPEIEVWDVNEIPFNRVFIQPLSDFDIAMGGLVIPEKAKGIPQKGKVHSAHPDSFCKAGDIVEYRKNTKLIYHTVTINRIQCDVLYEPDIFTVNDVVCPHRIIVKIDKAAQKIKRETTDMGLAIAPLFVGMLHNLQYGEIVGIGEKAKEHYPGLEEGDTAIIHHTVERDEHRLLWQETGKHGEVIFEYRMIEAFNPRAREIFGKVDKDSKKFSIIPFGNAVFLEWNLEMFEKAEDSVLDTDLSLSNCHNIEELQNAIQHKNKSAVDAYKAKGSSYGAEMEGYTFSDNPEQIEIIGRKYDQLKIDAQRMVKFVKKDYLVLCNYAFQPGRVVCPYKHIYPINILGRKFAIAHSDYLFFNFNNNAGMSTLENTTAIGDKILVSPIEEKADSALVIPEEAREKPQKGLILLVGTDVSKDEVPVGGFVFYRKGAGMEVVIDEVPYLMLRRNDCFLAVKPLEA